MLLLGVFFFKEDFFGQETFLLVGVIDRRFGVLLLDLDTIDFCFFTSLFFDLLRLLLILLLLAPRDSFLLTLAVDPLFFEDEALLRDLL